MTDFDDTPIIVLVDAHLLLRPPVDDCPPFGIPRPLHLVERPDQ